MEFLNTKPCSKCGLVRPLFNKRPECKTCRNEYLRKYKRKNAVRLRGYFRSYYHKNQLKRQRQMKSASEASPESFIGNLTSRILRSRRVRAGNMGSKAKVDDSCMCSRCVRYRTTKATVARSPQSFIKTLATHIKKKRATVKASPATLICDIDYDYLFTRNKKVYVRYLVSRWITATTNLHQCQLTELIRHVVMLKATCNWFVHLSTQ